MIKNGFYEYCKSMVTHIIKNIFFDHFVEIYDFTLKYT